MAEPFVEFGAEGIKYFVEKYWDRGYDSLKRRLNDARFSPRQTHSSNSSSENTAPPSKSGGGRPSQKNNTASHPSGCVTSQDSKHPASGLRGGDHSHTQRCHSALNRPTTSPLVRSPRPPHSHTSASLLSRINVNTQQQTNNMSYSNGNLSAGYGQQQQRANSAQPPRSRYYDDDEEYGSDYDDRSGRRYNDTGRGYDNQNNNDQGYGREVIETERYKGPARDFDARRQSFRSNDPYGPGAVTQYNRQQGDDYSRRSRSRGSRASRGRRDRSVSRSRSRSYSRSRSGSRDGGRDRGIQHKIGEHFDTSLQGIGVGLAGAVVGGMAGRHFGERNPRHKNRDILIGALVGGLGANAAETKYRGWMDEKKDKVRDDEERWDQKWDGRDYGRSRSSMR